MKIKLNIRRTVAILMAGFTLSGSLVGEVRADESLDDYLTHVSLITQKEDILQTSDYLYMNNYFGNNGCGPASLTNALLTLFKVTDHDTAIEIVEEVLRLFSYKHNKKNRLTLDNLSLLDLDLNGYLKDHEDLYPNLARLVLSYNGDIIYSDKTLQSEMIRHYITLDHSLSYFFIYKDGLKDNWVNVLDTVKMLYDDKRYDANMFFTMISGGTNGTSGPFRSGTSGHYLTFVINVRDFYEHGTIYVLDSYPRALAGDEVGDRYRTFYDFVNSRDRNLQTFNTTYTVSRLADNVLRVDLNDKKRLNLEWLLSVGHTGLANQYRLLLLEPFITYGTGAVILFVPCKYAKVK